MFGFWHRNSVCHLSVCLWLWCSLLKGLNFPAIFLHHIVAKPSGSAVKKTGRKHSQMYFPRGLLWTRVVWKSCDFRPVSPLCHKWYGHSYNVRWTGNHTWSIEWCHLQLPRMTDPSRSRHSSTSNNSTFFNWQCTPVCKTHKLTFLALRYLTWLQLCSVWC